MKYHLWATVDLVAKGTTRARSLPIPGNAFYEVSNAPH